MSNIKLTADGIKYISGGTTTTILNTDGEASGCVTTSSSNTFSDNIFVETSGKGVGIHKPGTSITSSVYTQLMSSGFIGFNVPSAYTGSGIGVSNTNILMIWNNHGEIIISGDSHITLRAASNKNINFFSEGVYSNSTYKFASDNRLKHNEKSFKSPLQGIRKLNPLQYFKTQTLYDENHHFELDTSGNPIDSSGNLVDHVIENGLIAQELLQHEEFKPFVFVSKEIDEETGQEQPMSVAYNSIFVYAIAALKELDAAHTQTKLELDETKQRLQALEERMAALENR